MGDLVDLKEIRTRRRRFRKRLHLTAHRLREIEAEVLELAVGLAMDGPLASWAQQQPVGTFAHIDEATLTDTKDPHLVTLVQLCSEIYGSVQRLYAHPLKK